MARKAMTAGDWNNALASFQAAVESSQAIGDARTTAIAQLDQARCEILLNQREKAGQIYRSILTNADASSSIAGLAQMEYLALRLLEDDRKGALDVLLLREPPAEGPLSEAISCLGGEMSASELAARIEGMPAQFQNDACFVVALRYYFDGEIKHCSSYMKRCIQISAPSYEWPAPFAKRLYTDLLR
jgi:hypothetical protein